ncbi:tripartite tricarboxylate transporter substrate binding protein [Cellulosilyticum sp. I15G10I2]|uniref:tripartite tricarboxylate transporter substrate binding protein n=1 Tax=Cellulosilyticum sp. I15G10I2 TaxID=1892843 RepID=UPI00085C68A5|nr:tripartite tricarboxylate transporter substrate binding protein [Cellulosilyticum sp. I15G10I2]
MKKMTKVLGCLLVASMIGAVVGGCAKSSTSNPSEAGASVATDTNTTTQETTTASDSLKWTDKSVAILIPGTPGGGSDLTTRYLTQSWNELTGVKFQPENYDTTVASFKSLIGKKADGLNLAMAHSALVTQYVTGATDIHPLEDVTLIANIGNNGLRALAVPSDAPYDTFEEFLEYIKANPGKVKAGISPNGTTQFLMGTLENKLGIKFNYVEASAETDRLTNLAGGFIDIGSISLSNGLEYEKAGKLKVIATVGANGAKIADFDPSAPENYRTIQEMGYENVYAVTNYYVIGPAGMDEEQVKAISESLKGITDKGSAYVKGMIEMGQVPEWYGLEESKAILEDELNTLTDVAKALEIYNVTE